MLTISAVRGKGEMTEVMKTGLNLAFVWGQQKSKPEFS